MSAYVPTIGSGFTSSARAVGVSDASRLRITRRGKIVLAVVLSLPTLAVVGAMATSGAPAVATTSATAADFSYVSVSAGESLWDVAERVAPTVDPRDVIAEIMRLNSLDSSAVDAGQSLAIPASYAG